MFLFMQIHEAARMPDEPRSFCSTWVDHLVLSLPTLALAIDDSLMALVERCVKHLAAGGATSPVQAQSQPTALSADQVGRAYHTCLPFHFTNFDISHLLVCLGGQGRSTQPWGRAFLEPRCYQPHDSSGAGPPSQTAQRCARQLWRQQAHR